MPTVEDLDRYYELRGRFLMALWDDSRAAQQYGGFSQVDEILGKVGLTHLPDDEIADLINGLKTDYVIEAMDARTFDENYDGQVKLTSAGRSEVAQWVRAGDKPTDHLQVPYSVVVNNTTVNHPQGSVVNVGSTDTTITVNNQFGEKLHEVVVAARTLLAQDGGLSPDDREDVEDNIVILEEQAGQPEPNKSRIRKALKDLSKWAVAAVALAGSQEVQHLTTEALQSITG